MDAVGLDTSDDDAMDAMRRWRRVRNVHNRRVAFRARLTAFVPVVASG